ncbi:hypothetical protein C8R44DRAFT_990750 [Mycena epipterygia]|nr:hypothetical protein C8R44DRAFT_990750 [Mycena epipterygia]
MPFILLEFSVSSHAQPPPQSQQPGQSPDRLADMGFSIPELMALIGAHCSTGKQRFQASSKETTFDSTPDAWDIRFYSETQSTAVVPHTYKLASDIDFSTNATTQKDYNRFVGK